MPSNLLLLDEPTNHLDIPAREAIESFLLESPATLLVVSPRPAAARDGLPTLWVVDDGLAVAVRRRLARVAGGGRRRLDGAARRPSASAGGCGRAARRRRRRRGRVGTRRRRRGADRADRSSSARRPACRARERAAPARGARSCRRTPTGARRPTVDAELTRLGLRKSHLELAMGDPAIAANFVEMRRVTSELADVERRWPSPRTPGSSSRSGAVTVERRTAPDRADRARSAAASRRSPAGSPSSARVVIDADVVAREVTAPGEPAHDAVIAPVRRRAYRRPTAASTGRRSRGSCSRDPAALARARGDRPPARPAADPGRSLRGGRGRGRAGRRDRGDQARRGRRWRDLCDEVWLVTCDAGGPARPAARPRRDAADADRRIAAQGGITERLRPAATRVIDTSGDPGAAREAVVAAWHDAHGPPERQKRVGHPARGGGPGGLGGAPGQRRGGRGAMGGRAGTGRRGRPRRRPAVDMEAAPSREMTRPVTEPGWRSERARSPGSATGSAPGSGSGRCRAGRPPAPAGRTSRSACSSSRRASTRRRSGCRPRAA